MLYYACESMPSEESRMTKDFDEDFPDIEEIPIVAPEITEPVEEPADVL